LYASSPTTYQENLIWQSKYLLFCGVQGKGGGKKKRKVEAKRGVNDSQNLDDRHPDQTTGTKADRGGRGKKRETRVAR